MPLPTDDVLDAPEASNQPIQLLLTRQLLWFVLGTAFLVALMLLVLNLGNFFISPEWIGRKVLRRFGGDFSRQIWNYYLMQSLANAIYISLGLSMLSWYFKQWILSEILMDLFQQVIKVLLLSWLIGGLLGLLLVAVAPTFFWDLVEQFSLGFPNRFAIAITKEYQFAWAEGSYRAWYVGILVALGNCAWHWQQQKIISLD